jgi:hypothetical protein
MKVLLDTNICSAYLKRPAVELVPDDWRGWLKEKEHMIAHEPSGQHLKTEWSDVVNSTSEAGPSA